MAKEQVLALLELVVEHEQQEHGEHIADCIHAATSVRPRDWTAVADGIEWFGYTFYETFSHFSFNGCIATMVKDTIERRTWYGRRVYDDIGSEHYIDSATALVDVLHREPHNG